MPDKLMDMVLEQGEAAGLMGVVVDRLDEFLHG